MSIPTIQAAPAAPTAAAVTQPAGWPVLRLGFRPFYLGAALFAVLAIPLWLALLLGPLSFKPAVDPLLWHAHEMLFGFALAVVIGFLLTAGKAWTGLATPRGAQLGVLALLWAGARVAALTGPYALYALLDLVLLPLVAAVMIELLLRAGNKRNLPLAGVLVLLALANGVFHLGVIGVAGLSPLMPLAALHAALALVIVIECVMAGRVVPAFTVNATPGLKITTLPALERTALAASVAALALWVFAPPGGVLAAIGGLLFFAAAALHAIRQWRWRPGVTLGRPILWALHAGYVWIAIGFVLLGLAQFGLIANSAGVHALAVGATAGLIIAMMTRTARGHTGRPLKASRAEVAAYALVAAAALLRVLGPLAAPQSTPQWLIGAALAWCAAFAIYLAVFAPWLLSTRLDGKDG